MLGKNTMMSSIMIMVSHALHAPSLFSLLIYFLHSGFKVSVVFYPNLVD